MRIQKDLGSRRAGNTERTRSQSLRRELQSDPRRRYLSLKCYVHVRLILQELYQSLRTTRVRTSQQLSSEIQISAERQLSPVIQRDDTLFALLNEGWSECSRRNDCFSGNGPRFKAARTQYAVRRNYRREESSSGGGSASSADSVAI